MVMYCLCLVLTIDGLHIYILVRLFVINGHLLYSGSLKIRCFALSYRGELPNLRDTGRMIATPLPVCSHPSPPPPS